MAFTQIHSDTFSGTVDENLEVHTPDMGVGYTQDPNSSTPGGGADPKTFLVDVEFSVFGGVLRQKAFDVSPETIAYTIDTVINETNYKIKGTHKVISAASNTRALCVNWIDFNNHYGLLWRADISTNNVRLYRKQAGTPTLLGEGSVTVAEGDTFELEIDGSGNLTVRRNNVDLITAIDTNLAQTKKAALGEGNVSGFGAPWDAAQQNANVLDNLEIWEQAETAGQTISPTAIASAESVSVPQINLGLAPSAIASSEAFGTAQINLQIAVVGDIPTAEALGSPQVNLNLAPNGIASTEAFGAANIQPGPVTISPTGIPSSEAFGAPKVNVGGAQTVSPAAIASGEAFGALQINLELLPLGTASAEAFGSAVIALEIKPSGIAAAEAFGTAQINIFIEPLGIESAEAFGTPVFPGAITTIQPIGILSAEAFGVMVLKPGFAKAIVAADRIKNEALMDEIKGQAVTEKIKNEAVIEV